MRRPSVPGRSSRAAPSAGGSVAPEPNPAPAGDEEETQPIEPLAAAETIDLGPVLLRADDEAAAPAVEPRNLDEEPEGVAGDEAVPVTARDVWRATRARRRAQRDEARRFTARARRKRWVRIGVVASMLAVIAGIVAIAYSPLFAVRNVAVSGASDELAANISSALQGHVGTPLAAVDLNTVRETVETFPLVESYRVEAHPPHELLVRIVQRTPIGAVRADGEYALVDAAGVQLSRSPELPAGQPLIDIDPQQSPIAFEAAGTAIRALPEALRAQVAEVHGATGDDTVVQLNTGVSVAWGSGDESALKAIVVERLITANPQATSFDVSAPEVPVVR